ncbi:MAG: PAC2 family protein [Sedimentisphaerales bacterium]|nr:PAC2 family protein [Sedimentisphaerales bacterium]
MNRDAHSSNVEIRASKFETSKGAQRFRWRFQPRLKKSSFLVGWAKDAGAVSSLATNHLIQGLGGSEFCRMEPAGFYPLGGVTVADDVAQFPQSRFFHVGRGDLVILQADEPQSNRYEFLSAVLDLAEHYAGTQVLCTVNGVAALTPHTTTRRVFGVFNDAALQRRLQPLLPADANWQGPPHVSTYLLWLAGQRQIPGVGLWVEVPFYLSDYEDYQSVKEAVSLLAMILGLDFDLGELDRLTAEQNDKLAQLKENPQIKDDICALEEGQPLDRHGQKALIEAVGSALQGSP